MLVPFLSDYKYLYCGYMNHERTASLKRKTALRVYLDKKVLTIRY